MKKATNPLVWGAVAGVAGVAIVLLTQWTGREGPDNPLLQSPVSAGVVCFFWGWVAGNVKNWYWRWLSERRR